MIEILQLLFIGAVGIAGIIIWGSILALPGSFLVWKFSDGEEIEEEFVPFSTMWG